jgi:PAS domain S-box-containing protein
MMRLMICLIATCIVDRKENAFMPFPQRLRAFAHTYPTQLAMGLCLLIILTTLSAGLPAYWLSHQQLNEQVATHLRDAQQATLSLLQNEEQRLANIALLFAQRPTLVSLLPGAPQQSLDAAAQAKLDAYIRNFQAQIDLDLLLICRPDATLLAATPPIRDCPAGDGFAWVEQRPALVARHALTTTTSGASRGTVVTGIWLGPPFLRQLAAATGVQQTIVAPTATAVEGKRLVSTLDLPDLMQQPATLDSNVVAPLQAGGHAYYRLLAPLRGVNQQTIFYSEILLPADELVATRNRVIAILLTSTAAVALLGMGLGFWSIRRLTQPLASLTTQAELISQGEFERPIPDFGGPLEVRTLSAALQRSQASLLQALDERAAARDRLDNLVQSLVEGVVIIDSAGKITFWSQGAALITGWPAADALGKSLDQVLPPVETNQAALLASLPAAGQRRRLAVLTSGGKSSVLEVTSIRSAKPLASAQVDPPERALVLRDVTEEEAMQHLRAYFLANISHEFRTPLSTLNASMELLMDESQESEGKAGKDDEAGVMMSRAEMRSLLKPIHLSLLELQTLIDNLLEGSIIEAGEFRLRKREMTINEAITGALTVVQPMFERRRQTISVTEPATLGHLYADRVRLTQVLVNLLANASKYTPMGEAVDMTVEVRCASEPMASPSGDAGTGSGEAQEEPQDESSLIYRVLVTDRGPGIPAAERVNLFRRFVRLDSTLGSKGGDQTADVHGTGIGLHVVKTTVEAHGGRVGIEERPGGGSVFWFEVPRGDPPAS